MPLVRLHMNTHIFPFSESYPKSKHRYSLVKYLVLRKILEVLLVSLLSSFKVKSNARYRNRKETSPMSFFPLR